MEDSQTIYLGADDDVTQAIDHLAECAAENVFFVVPEEAEILSSVVNLRLLKREADLEGKIITIVSSDEAGKHLAEKAQVHFIAAGEYFKKDAGDGKNFSGPLEGKLVKNEAVAKDGGVAVPIRRMADIISIKSKPETIKLREPVLIQEHEAVAESVAANKERHIDISDSGNNKIDEKSNSDFSFDQLAEKELVLPVEDQVIGAAADVRSGSQIENVPSVPESVDSYLPPILRDPENYAQSPTYQRAEESYLSKYQNGANASHRPLSDTPGNLAEEIGLSGAVSAVSPKPAKRKSFFSSRSKNFISPVKTAIPGMADEKGKRIAGSGWRRFILILFGLAAITFLVAGYFILPKATLAITLKKEVLPLSLSVVADKNISKTDFSLKKIPAQIVKVEKKETKDFPATGVTSGSSKAKGMISVYNAYSESPQTLVQSTRFVSESGKVFRTTKAITIPGAKSAGGKLTPVFIDAEVVADQAGPDYNISPSKFTIPGFEGSPKYKGFYGVSNSAMSGGSSGAGKAISSRDLESARAAMDDLVNEETEKLLKDQIPANFKVLDNALQRNISGVVFSQPEGAAVGTFSAVVNIEIQALVFDEKNLNELIDKNFAASGAADKSLLPNSRQIDYNDSKVDFTKGQIILVVAVSQDAVSKLDLADLKKKLAGEGESGIKKTLGQMPGIQNAKVNFWPFWVKSIPEQTSRIDITIENGN